MNEELFASLSEEIINSDIFNKSREFIQHGKTTIFEHSVDVARMSLRMAEFFKIKDKRSLIRSALLHDFFLYDWHVPFWSTHGWTHPVTAAENGKKYFNITDKEYSLIRTHMWPYTLLHPPVYREGWIICMADKVVTVWETLFKKKRH